MPPSSLVKDGNNGQEIIQYRLSQRAPIPDVSMVGSDTYQVMQSLEKKEMRLSNYHNSEEQPRALSVMVVLDLS